MGQCLGKSPPPPQLPPVAPPKDEHKQRAGGIRAASHSHLDPADRFGVRSQYQSIKFAGKGAAGDVWVCRDLRSQDIVAIKFMKRPISPANQPLVKRELMIHSLLSEGHVNIIRAYDALLTSSHLGLIMEYAAGGNLTSYVAKKHIESKQTGLYCSEDEARYFFRQFISAVAYCHRNSVAHRDLKLDNVLLDGSDPPILKLTDFGYAKTWTGLGRNTMNLGTVVYMPPELIKPASAEQQAGAYDPQEVDVWASGVLLTVMMLGKFPFDNTENTDPNAYDAQLEVWQQEVTHKWHESKFLEGKVEKLSASCRDLLDKIFVVDHKQRITVKQIMNHEWYNMPLPPRYQKVLDNLNAEQRELDAVNAAQEYDADLMDTRNEAIVFLVKEAARKASPSIMSDMASLQIVDYLRDDIKHINLTRAAVYKGAAADFGDVMSPAGGPPGTPPACTPTQGSTSPRPTTSSSEAASALPTAAAAAAGAASAVPRVAAPPAAAAAAAGGTASSVPQAAPVAAAAAAGGEGAVGPSPPAGAAATAWEGANGAGTSAGSGGGGLQGPPAAVDGAAGTGTEVRVAVSGAGTHGPNPVAGVRRTATVMSADENVAPPPGSAGSGAAPGGAADGAARRDVQAGASAKAPGAAARAYAAARQQ